MPKLVITINGDELDGHTYQDILGAVVDALPRGEAVFELGDGADLYDQAGDPIGEWTVTP
jgi:hypothetical protein